MSSDPPPTTTPNDNPDALFTPEPQRPSRVNVITQDSENASQELDFSSMPAQEARNTFQDQQHYYTEEWLSAHGETESSPLLEPSTVAHAPTPIVHSPTISKSKIRNILMDSNTMESREIAASASSMVFLSNTATQKCCSPKSNYLSFLP